MKKKTIKMPQISIVQRKDVLQAKRFDAEYFKPEYLEVEKNMNNLQYDTIKNIFYPIKNGVDFRQFEEDGQIYYIRTADIKDYGFQDTGAKINFSKIPVKVKLKENDILFTRKGNYGKNCLVTNEIKNSLISSEIMLLRKRDNQFNCFYLSIFLRTKYGTLQIERRIHGVSNFSVTQEAVESIRIPIFSQQFQLKIEKLVKQAHKELQESKQLYKQAEQLLLQELDLVDYQPQHSLWFEVNKREVDRARRYDAEYFQPKYSEIIEKIEKYGGGFDVAKNIVSWKKGIEVGSDAYTDEGKQFVRVSDFSIFGIENTTKKISTELFQKLKGDFQPRKGEILFTKDGTIGISSVIQKEVKGIVSVAFLRLILKTKYKNFEKECLSLIFNSIICKLQAEQLSGGAIIEHLKPDDFGKIKIPLIQSDIQQKIADNITQSHKLREHSKQLLDTAKHAVETAIEKGESAGAKCIVDNYEKRTKSIAKNKE